ncbi:ABC transporter F family member 3 [Zancudomyces culisetae]|uniref:ABC transporter F family member 3 n=1 Tax=Zancudomyces culisetae TaxID=1213189 RepID=A0A1R1PNU6_ZANCU|nr:ABC transporter F family member 3 [Zancudomyces culisetae]|eukprot:OMH82552.1 ABC transporter F family member 3 [Zancudomyces culisetae]
MVGKFDSKDFIKVYLSNQSKEKLGVDSKEYLEGILGETYKTEEGLEEFREAAEPFFSEAGLSEQELDSLIEKLGAMVVKSEKNVKKAGTKLPIEAIQRIPVEKAPVSNKDLTPVEMSPSNSTKGVDKDKKAKQKESSPKEENDISGPVIQAFSQVSRFHTETLVTNLNEINLKDVNLIVNDVPLLVDAHLQLKEGVHYGFIGRNGLGKSTLLTCMANKTLIGLPENIRIQYVEQLEVLDTQKTVLETVLEADEQRTKILKVIHSIEPILSKPKELKERIDEYIHQKAKDDTFLKQKIANHRSRKRGLYARKVALDAEINAVKYTTEKYYGVEGEGEGIKTDSEVASAILAELYEELELTGSDKAESKAMEVLIELGFTKEETEEPVSKFSGGWRMRVVLAKAMFMEPDVLLMDEPTNHLDMLSIVWLTEYVKSLDGVTVVVVSHDREFLNQVSQEIMLIKDLQLKYYSGNYDGYLKIIDDLKKKKLHQIDSIERKKKHINESIQKGLAHVRSTGDDKRLGMIASRKKKLDRLGAEKTEDGRRFKVSYYAGYHFTSRAQVELEREDKDVVMKIPEPEPLRQAGPLIRLFDLSFSYTDKQHMVIKNVSLDIEMGDRIAILGPNGTGKSTLINLMKENLTPNCGGRIETHPRVKIGHFDQHFVDRYSQVKISALQYMLESYPSKFSEQSARSYLGSFGLPGDVAARQPVSTLSGGQRARLALSVVLVDAPNLLLLDEITNHLDMKTISGLIEALKEYPGAIVLVSHDQYFVSQLAHNYYLIDKGYLKVWDGDVKTYISKYLKI